MWELIERRALQIHVPEPGELARIKALMEIYADTPMDLADASLVAVAERLGLRRVFTLDGDFRIYRIHGRETFEVAP